MALVSAFWPSSPKDSWWCSPALPRCRAAMWHLPLHCFAHTADGMKRKSLRAGVHAALEYSLTCAGYCFRRCTYSSLCLSVSLILFPLIIVFPSISSKMELSYTGLILLLCLISPLNVLAQRHRGPGGGRSSAAPPATPATAPIANTNTATVATSAAVGSVASEPATTAAQSIDTDTVVATGAGTGSATASAANPSSTGGGGGGGSCSGSGMEIQWSGDKVDFSWSGGSGTTTGCTSLGSSFQGQVAVGGSGGTIFEGNPSGFFDVSYILGYSVPMVCSSGGVKTGCSKDLLGNGGKAGTVHKNPTGPGGAKDPGSYTGCATCKPWCYACSAADPFFAPCAGSAYTYPYDDAATVGPASGTINCCIGTSCGSTGREGSGSKGHAQPTRNPPCGLCAGSSKRSVDELEVIFKRYEAEAPAAAFSPSLLPRKRKAHKRHAVAHEAKVLA